MTPAMEDFSGKPGSINAVARPEKSNGVSAPLINFVNTLLFFEIISDENAQGEYSELVFVRV